MKKLFAIILVALVLMTMAIPTLAAEDFDFEPYISDFAPTTFTDVTLNVGETDSPADSVHLSSGKGEVHVSNEAVVKVNSKGIVTAVGEGTAYVVIIADHGEDFTYRYTVTTESKTDNSQMMELPSHKELLDSMMADNPLSGVFSAVGIGSALIFVIFVLAVGFIISAIGRVNKLNKALDAAIGNPCQETAENVIKACGSFKGLYRINMNFPFESMRNAFNEYLNPCPSIRTATKQELRMRLAELDTRDLHPVAKTAEEVRVLTDAFGQAGEQNVWHNLSGMFAMGKYDIFRNVKLPGAEIDAIVVAENGGIFLLEVKSVGGKRLNENFKLVSYQDLKEDPGNQMIRHKAAFINAMSHIGIGAEQIRDVLVISYPHGQERRMIDHNTFPRSFYQVVEVDRLLGYLTEIKKPTMDLQTRKAIAQKLMPCSQESLVDCLK